LTLALYFSTNLRFRSDQRIERAKDREVLREKFFIVDSDPQVTFHKGNRVNEPERVEPSTFRSAPVATPCMIVAPRASASLSLSNGSFWQERIHSGGET